MGERANGGSAVVVMMMPPIQPDQKQMELLLVNISLPQAEVVNMDGPHDEQHTSYPFVEPEVCDLLS